MDSRPDWEVIGSVKTLDLNGTSVQAFVFRADITDFRAVLILSDGWDVLASTASFPEEWRTLDPGRLVELIGQHSLTEMVDG